MLVDDGLAMIADTRTNAGVDNISSYRKLHIYKSPGERILAVATAGNLSVTQTALAMVAAGVKLPDSTELETLQTAPTLSAPPSFSVMRWPACAPASIRRRRRPPTG